MTGFYVAPRVVGENVTLAIEARRDVPGEEAAGSVALQRVNSIVSGRLGEWIEVGGLAEQGGSQQSGIANRTSQSSADRRRVMIKVEELR